MPRVHTEESRTGPDWPRSRSLATPRREGDGGRSSADERESVESRASTKRTRSKSKKKKRPPSEAPPALVVGDHVQLQGLPSKHLNGRAGVIARVFNDGKRGVRVPGRKGLVSAFRRQMVLVAPPDAAVEETKGGDDAPAVDPSALWPPPPPEAPPPRARAAARAALGAAAAGAGAVGAAPAAATPSATPSAPSSVLPSALPPVATRAPPPPPPPVAVPEPEPSDDDEAAATRARSESEAAEKTQSSWIESVRFGDLISLEGHLDPALVEDSFFVRGDATSGQVDAALSDADFRSCLWRVVPALKYEKLESWCRAKTNLTLDRRHDRVSVSALLDSLGVRLERPPAKTAPAAAENLAALKVQRETKGNAEKLAATLGAAKESDIPNFNGSSLGRFPLATLEDAGTARSRDLMFNEPFQLQHVVTGMFFTCASSLGADLDTRRAPGLGGEDGRPRKLLLHPGCAGSVLLFSPMGDAGEVARRAPVSYNDSAFLLVRPQGDGAPGKGKGAKQGGRRLAGIFDPVETTDAARAIALSPCDHVATARCPLRELAVYAQPSPLAIRPYARYPSAALRNLVHNTPFFLLSQRLRRAVVVRDGGTLGDHCAVHDEVDDADDDLGSEDGEGAREAKVGFQEAQREDIVRGAGSAHLESAMMAFVAEPVMRRGPGNDLLTRGICFGDVFHVRHAVTGAYLAMAPTVAPVKGPGGVDRRDALLFDDDDGPDSVDDATRALLAFKLLPGGPEPRPPLGTPVLDGMACLVASAARPLRLHADADATSVSFSELPSISDADGGAETALTNHESYYFDLRYLTPKEHEELTHCASLRRVSHVYTAVCKTLSMLPPNAGLTSPRKGDESRDDDAFGGPMRGSDARKVLAALASVTRSLQRTTCAARRAFLDDLVNMAVTPINLGLDIRFHGRRYADDRFDAYLAPVQKAVLAVLGRAILDNRECEAHFGVGSVLIRQGEALRALQVQGDAFEPAHRSPWLVLKAAILREVADKRHWRATASARERVLATLFISEETLTNAVVANAALVRKFCEFILQVHGPRAEFLEVLAALCTVDGKDGRSRSMLRMQEICGTLLFNTEIAGQAADLADHLLLAISPSDLRDNRAPSLPKEVHLSWNADSKEYRVEAVDELFYDAYSPKLFFRDGLKEVLWPGAPRHAEARPAIEVYALGEQLQPVKKVRRADGIAWVKESDLEMSEKNVSGPIRLKGDAELEALAAEATDRAGERKIATREERLLNQLQIGRYFEAQLKLLGDLCAGRSAQNILKLQARGGFSYETLVAVFRDARVAPCLRSETLNLLNNLYLDRWPHARVAAPALLWVLEDVESRRLSPGASADALPRSATPIAEPVRDGFAALRRELSRHLATSATLNPENVASNDLTAKVVDIASTLFDFGLFTVGTVDDTIDLARRLVDLANPAIDAPAVDKSHLKPVARAKARALRGLAQINDATMHWRIERILSYLFEEMGDRTFDVHKFPNVDLDRPNLGDILRTCYGKVIGAHSEELRGLVINLRSAIDTASTWIKEHTSAAPASPASVDGSSSGRRAPSPVGGVPPPVARDKKAANVLTTVTNALFWVEIFVYFDEDEDRKEAMPTECNIVLEGGADYDGGSGASTIDMVVATSPPPSWLPDWFLDRTNRPSHEAPLGPNAHHQSICFSLGLIDILILALKMGRSLIKTTDSNQPGASNAMAVLVDVRVRVKRLVDAVVYCLLSLIDGHTLAKTSVLERIEDIIDCIEVTSPKNLADRALIRLICSYAHQGARELCEGGEHVRADADSFLCATLQLLRTIAGGDERQPHPAVQSCIEDALFENQDLGAIERFRRIATASSTSPAKAAQTSAKAGASIASQDTRVALIQLLETVARDRAALSIRNVLPIPFLAKELITLDAHKTELSIRVQTILGNLLYHVFFATGEPELVLFTETLRSLLLNDEPPEAEGLQRLQASLLVLKTFAEAVTAQEKARRDEAGRGRLKEELEEQKKRIGLVSITAYKALAHWTKRSDRPREEARLLRSSIGLAGRCAGRAARMLAPDELEAAVMTDQQRLAKSQESSSTSLMKNVKAAKVPKTMFDVSSMFVGGDEEAEARASDFSRPKPAIEHVLNTLVLDEFFELRMEQERIALLLLLRGDPLKIDKDDDGGDDAESEDDEEEKKSEAGDHVAVEIEDEPFLKEATPSKRPRAAKAPAKEVELAPAPAKKAAKSAAADVEPALAKKGTGEATPPHPGIAKIHARFLKYMRDRMDCHEPHTTKAKIEIVKLIREHLVLVAQTDSTSTFIATDNPYSVFSPQERKVQFLLDVRRAVARTVLDDVLEGNVVMAFIMLLVIGTILYEQVLGLMYGLSNGFVDTYVLFLIMWIFTAEVTIKMTAHVYCHRTLSKFFTDFFCVMDLLLVLFDLISYYAFESSGGATNNLRTVRMLKLFKSARIMRVVGRAVKIRRAKMAAAQAEKDNADMLDLIGNESETTLRGLHKHGVAAVCVDTLDSAGDGVHDAELGEETYKLAMTLLNTGNKEIYDAFQACARSNSAEKQFFAERVIWDTTVFSLPGALAAHSETTDVERYERAETEARGLESASSKAVALGAFAPDAREIVETTKTAEAISSSELAERWLASIVANYSAADQLLIQHAIETSTKKGVPETSPAINEAKTALMGLRYGQLNAVLVAALGMLSVLMTDSISKMLDACTDGVNFATVVTPNEPELTQLSQWSTEGKIYFVSLSVGFMNFWIAVYMLCYMEWNKRRDTNEKTLKRFAGILNSYGSVDKFAALLSIISSLNYGISVTSIFSVVVTLVATKTAKTIEKTVANLPKVQDWMLDPDARFTSTSHLRRLLLSIAPSASKHIEEAVALLSEGDLERASEAELMDLVVAESSRIMYLAKDLGKQLHASNGPSVSTRQRQPTELLLLLRNAVRFPRVVKAKKG
ncbi:cellulose 1,4-beta-cellobiosidase [Aureococcus anophagefferens]|nr:cellulose 1,4-beta-cellobiosidase [Aureococcus anophagefferens]